MTTVLVTGATGAIGAHLVPALRRRGIAVRAFVRDPAKAAGRFGDDVAVAVGDFTDAASLAAALTGVDRVFVNSADGPDKVDHEVAVIDAAAKARVTGIVKLSSLGAQPGSPLPGLDWHGRVEEHLARCGVPAVVLRANFLMSNLLATRDAIVGGQLPAPAGTGTVSMIDPRDVVDVAAAVLSAKEFQPGMYVLTGGQAISYHDVAQAIAGAAGHRVDYVDVPEAAAVRAWTESGAPPWLVTHLAGAFRLIRDNALAPCTNTVQTVTGQPPRSIAAYARDHAAQFGAPSNPSEHHLWEGASTWR